MIEKLEKQNTWGECLEKLNELVSVVNKHEDIIRQIGEWGSSKGECLWCENLTEANFRDHMIGCVTLKIPESYKTDPHAGQEKWVGKLCKFWDDNGASYYATLAAIDKSSPYPYCSAGDWWWEHCCLVKPDDDIIYKGE